MTFKYLKIKFVIHLDYEPVLYILGEKPFEYFNYIINNTCWPMTLAKIFFYYIIWAKMFADLIEFL